MVDDVLKYARIPRNTVLIGLIDSIAFSIIDLAFKSDDQFVTDLFRFKSNPKCGVGNESFGIVEKSVTKSPSRTSENQD